MTISLSRHFYLSNIVYERTTTDTDRLTVTSTTQVHWRGQILNDLNGSSFNWSEHFVLLLEVVIVFPVMDYLSVFRVYLPCCQRAIIAKLACVLLRNPGYHSNIGLNKKHVIAKYIHVHI